MDAHALWELVDQARAAAGDDADELDLVIDHLTTLLLEKDPDKIALIDQQLWQTLRDSHRAELWMAAAVVNGAGRDDGFDAFRGWLIAQGQEVFTRVVAAPDRLADLPAVVHAAHSGALLDGGEVLMLAAEVYQQVTGQELPQGRFAVLPDFSAVDLTNDTMLRRHLPRLTALFRS